MPGRARKPNFLVILIDDLRFDEVGICGHPYMKTPHIDRIGRELYQRLPPDAAMFAEPRPRSSPASTPAGTARRTACCRA
ncbi:MAG TPA: hypothetical protein VJ890_07370 [Vineibacter sp.]|nr:hypothetical protein [Vineibacter sp.]